MLDFSAFRDGKQTFAEFSQNFSKSELHSTTDEMYDAVNAAIADATDADVVFQPLDPAANDTFGKPEEANMAWTLGHVIVHLTASQEEAAALASDLARGIVPDWRSRYETDWQTVQSVNQIRTRLAESRRMCHAFLDTWPNEAHLDVAYTPIPSLGSLNPISRFVLGFLHSESHLEQLREIMRQAKAARTAETA